MQNKLKRACKFHSQNRFFLNYIKACENLVWNYGDVFFTFMCNCFIVRGCPCLSFPILLILNFFLSNRTLRNFLRCNFTLTEYKSCSCRIAISFASNQRSLKTTPYGSSCRHGYVTLLYHEILRAQTALVDGYLFEKDSTDKEIL